MVTKHIPYYVDPPLLSPSLIEEITNIIFGEPGAPRPCDVIFIFGGSHPGLWENGSEAYFKGLGKDIIATGGYKPTALRHASWQDDQRPESEVIRRELIRLGVPEESIYIETKSTNTYENVRLALEIYDFDCVSSVLAICKSYAVGRQVRTLKAQLDPDVQIIPYPFDTHLGGDGPFVTRENWMDYQKGRAYMFANLLKIHHYGQAGHLVPVIGLSDELGTILQNYFEE
jgi:uncharacterized SAM-binding protein YcdF (DUF218 family)